MSDAHAQPADDLEAAETAPTVDMDDEAADAGAAQAEPEVDPDPTPVPRLDPVIGALRAELAAKDEQLRQYITAYKQATADMTRERERMAKERATIADVEKMALAGTLLEVLDNLDRSLAGCAKGTADDVAAGLRLVRDQFFGALEDLGVARVDGVGAQFDPSVHEATGMIPAQGNQADQEIVYEELPGYTFKGKLLRAARVVVASKP